MPCITKSLSDSSLTGMGTTLTAGTLAAGDTMILGPRRRFPRLPAPRRRVAQDHHGPQPRAGARRRRPAHRRRGRRAPACATSSPARWASTTHVEVDVYPVELQVDDRILLCSDGLTDMVHEDTIAAELRREPDPAVAAHKLVDTANARVASTTSRSWSWRSPAATTATASRRCRRARRSRRSRSLVSSTSRTQPERGGVTPVETPSRRERRAQRRGTAEPGRRSRRVKTTLWVLAVLVVIGVALGAIA